MERGTREGILRLEPPELALVGRPGPTNRRLAAGETIRRRETEHPLGVTADEGGSEEDLEGEQSPWETRAMHSWKRRCVATDSSVEKCLEVSGSTRTALTATPGNGRCRRSHNLDAAPDMVRGTSVSQPVRHTLQGHPQNASRHDPRVAGRRRKEVEKIGSPVSSLPVW
jgi:hypothetical protein